MTAKHSRREVSSMRQQLGAAFPTNRRQDKKKNYALPPLENWKAEGVDHIRIDRDSSDPLGKYLFPEHYCPFRHHIFDRFTSISGFWLYITLQDRNDIVRDMSGMELAQYRKRSAVRDVPQLRAIIADTYWRRLQTSPQIIKRLEESTLPFDVYFLSEGVGLRIRNRNAPWLVPMFEEIRRAVKEKREPDFDFLKFGRPADIYEDVIPKYGVNLTVEVQKRKKTHKRPQDKELVKNSNETTKEAVEETKTISEKGPRFEPSDSATIPLNKDESSESRSGFDQYSLTVGTRGAIYDHEGKIISPAPREASAAIKSDSPICADTSGVSIMKENVQIDDAAPCSTEPV